MKIPGFWTVCVLFLFLSSLRAQNIPSEMRVGIIFRKVISEQTIDELEKYARQPNPGQSGKVLDIVEAAYPDTVFRSIKSKGHFVVFMSVSGINQIVYIHESYKTFAEPISNRIFARGFYTIWINDDANSYVTSVGVETSRLTRSLRLSSFESTSPFESNRKEGPREVEIGIKYFSIPFLPANTNITFIRRDIDTYIKRTWSRSYRMAKPVVSLLSYDFSLGILVPFNDMELRRYKIFQNMITLDGQIDPSAYLTLSYEYPYRLDIATRNLPWYLELYVKLFPDIFVGVGLPVETLRLGDLTNNSYLFGFSWPIVRDLVKLNMAWEFSGDKLKDGFRVGDIVDDVEANPITSQTGFLIGLSASLDAIGNLVD